MAACASLAFESSAGCSGFGPDEEDELEDPGLSEKDRSENEKSFKRTVLRDSGQLLYAKIILEAPLNLNLADLMLTAATSIVLIYGILIPFWGASYFYLNQLAALSSIYCFLFVFEWY